MKISEQILETVKSNKHSELMVKLDNMIRHESEATRKLGAQYEKDLKRYQKRTGDVDLNHSLFHLSFEYEDYIKRTESLRAQQQRLEQKIADVRKQLKKFNN